jgi:hypothetical protein
MPDALRTMPATDLTKILPKIVQDGSVVLSSIWSRDNRAIADFHFLSTGNSHGANLLKIAKENSCGDPKVVFAVSWMLSDANEESVLAAMTATGAVPDGTMIISFEPDDMAHGAWDVLASIGFPVLYMDDDAICAMRACGVDMVAQGSMSLAKNTNRTGSLWSSMDIRCERMEEAKAVACLRGMMCHVMDSILPTLSIGESSPYALSASSSRSLTANQLRWHDRVREMSERMCFGYADWPEEKVDGIAARWGLPCLAQARADGLLDDIFDWTLGEGIRKTRISGEGEAIRDITEMARLVSGFEERQEACSEIIRYFAKKTGIDGSLRVVQVAPGGSRSEEDMSALEALSSTVGNAVAVLEDAGIRKALSAHFDHGVGLEDILV